MNCRFCGAEIRKYTPNALQREVLAHNTDLGESSYISTQGDVTCRGLLTQLHEPTDIMSRIVADLREIELDLR